MNDKKAKQIFIQCIDELYRNSNPSISWEEIEETYADKPRSEFYMKHKINEDLYDKIVEKYKKKLPLFYRRQLSWFLLDYSPTFTKEK
jgi:hypothetical protein